MLVEGSRVSQEQSLREAVTLFQGTVPGEENNGVLITDDSVRYFQLSKKQQQRANDEADNSTDE